jgi:5-methylcytosine-specific restriction endonuclease McrA
LEWVASQEKRKAYFESYNKSAAGLKAKQDYYERNKELVIARAVARPQEDKNRYKKQWKDTHPAHITADRKNRRRKHRDASPAWLTVEDKANMREMYRMAMQLTKTTGTPYVVDHIVPLRHPLVCGMHVPWNLQVMTREENLKKSNKMDF